jgi:rhodanese-related sulfurtransferase
VDIQRDLVLITEPGKEEESILRLARVGYEKITGYLNGGVKGYDGPLDHVKTIEGADVESEMENGAIVLDVRKPNEWNIAHMKGATFLPLANFPDNLKDLDKSAKYIVHCGGGYRSMTAISIMKKLGFKDLINIRGGFGSMQKAGVGVVTDEVAA